MPTSGVTSIIIAVPCMVVYNCECVPILSLFMTFDGSKKKVARSLERSRVALEAKLKGAAPLTNRRLSFLIYQGDKLKLDFNHPRATGQIPSVRPRLKLKQI